jgi:hypothetical protein
MVMPYTPEQRQRIVQWVSQRVPRLIEQGCPLCGAAASSYGIEQIAVPDLAVPLLAVACRSCGYVMLFNEALILDSNAAP